MMALLISMLVCLCSMSMYLAEGTSTDLHVDTSIDLRDIMNRMERLENNDVVQNQLLHEQRANLQELQNVVSHQNGRLLYQNRLMRTYMKRLTSLERQLASIQNAAAKPKNVPDKDRTMDKPDLVQVKPNNGYTDRRVKKERIRQDRAVSGEPVAFFAKFHGAGQTNIGLNQNIVFPDVLINLGNGYHDLHGVFNTPRDGVYIFSVSIRSEWDSYIDFNIMINGNRVATALAAGNTNSHYGQGSVTVVSQLAVGDEVWVSLYKPVGTSLVGLDFSSFTGCLVTPI